MEPTETASRPHSQTLDETLCLLCEKKLQDKNNPHVKNPTLEGLKTTLKVAKERGDEIHERLSPH